jgi:sortase A
MNQRNLHIPSRATPNPRRAHGTPHEAAADYVREQIAQIYDEPATVAPIPQRTTHHAQHQHHATATALPQDYARTYREQQPKAAYDWQTYHSAWQNYYQQYYERHYLQQLHTERQESTNTQPEHTPQKQIVSGSVAAETEKEEAYASVARELKAKVGKRAAKVKKSPHFKPIVTALLVGFLFLFLQFNRTLTAQAKYYISPGTLTNDGNSIIVNPSATASVNKDPRIIIPKINVDVPVVYSVTSYDDSAIQNGLRSGVVHYGTTATPGQIGNNVIVGHSSNDLFDSGGYKFAFVLLDHLNNGDIIELNYQGKQYVYKVTNKAIVAPTDFSLVNVSTQKPLVTLITCTPPGTALKRLIVQAEQISPDPSGASQAPAQATTAASLPSSIPGNSPTMLQRLQKLLHF